MNKSDCIVLGGGGFIGSHLVERLIANKYQVTVLNHGSEKENKNLSPFIKKITYISGDIKDVSLINKITNTNSYVFDLVASSIPYSSMKSPVDEIKKHIFTHVKLIDAVCKKKVKKIIFVSSGGGIYGYNSKIPISEDKFLQPISPHAISKVAIEYYLSYFSKIYQIPHLIYRLSNPYGPKQIPKEGFGIIPTLFFHTLNRTTPTLFNKGNPVRDFIYINDVIDAIIMSFNARTKFQIYNIGSNKGVDLTTLWLTIKRITQSKLIPVYKEKRPIDADSIILNTKRFKQEFGWKPQIALVEGLIKTWQYFNK